MLTNTHLTDIQTRIYKYSCDECGFNSNNKNDYTRHMSSKKHSNKNLYNHICASCNKTYKSRVGLWKHSKTCLENIQTSNVVHNDTHNGDVIHELLKQNNDFKSLIMLQTQHMREQQIQQNEEKTELQKQMIDLQHQFLEAIKNGSLGNTTNSNNNTQNNQFNLQFYLNETCKDAINLDEFLQSIQLTSQDYVNTGEVGFITGLTDIFRKELHKLEPHNRPLQCTDVKREVIYVKENDKWAKDIENKKTKNIVRRIDISYQRMMYQWMKENPEHVEEEGPLVEEGIKYSTVCLGNNRLNGNEPIFRNKIFTNILDEIAIKKGNKIITVE